MKVQPHKQTLFLLGGLLVMSARAEMAIRADEKTQRYTIEDAGRPVLTYNFGPVPVPAGVTGKYAVARGDYVHPLYGPDGEVLTTDYSPDHPHHRGLYWAWPEVTFAGETRDLHALQGLFARPVRIIRQAATGDRAVLEAENVWKWGDATEIVRERAAITAHAARDGLQITDFRIVFEALQPGVTVARRGKAHYGGFNVRLSSRQNQTITWHVGSAATAPQKTWAELAGVPPEGKHPVGVFLLQKPANPDYPGDWQEYANLNWLQPTFPAKGAAHALVPGKPLALDFRVIVRSGAGLKAEPAALFDAYAGDCPDPLAALTAYAGGDSRGAMAAFESSVRTLAPAERPAAEQRLLKLLAAQPSSEFKRWSCRQLQVVGSAASVPTLAPYLKEDVWQEACDALLALPDPSGPSALLAALPQAGAERRATLIHALGLRRLATAVPALTAYAESEDPSVRDAALTALGRAATPEAADALLKLVPSGDEAGRVIDARLLCAQKLAAVSQGAQAKTLFLSVRAHATATSAQKAAALIGLAALAPAEFADVALSALGAKEKPTRQSAAAALRHADRATLEKARPLFASLPRDAKLALLTLWGERGVKAAEPETLGCLAAADGELSKAAVHALRRTGSAAAVRPLFDLALAGGEAGREAEATLRQLTGDGVAEALQAEARGADAKRAALAVSLLAERQDPGHLAFLLGFVKDGDERQLATALDALKRFADAETLTALTQALAGATGRQEPIAQTILSICKRQVVPPALQKAELQAALKSLHDDALRTPFKEVLASLGQQNLALGKKVTSSHPWQGNLRPELAVDGKPDTYWSCAFSPAWIQVDLTVPTPASRIKVVNYVDGTRYYQYKVEVSADGRAWTCVGDMSANTAPATKEGATFTLQAAAARYVRVTMLKNSANPGLHISELGVYGGDE